MAGSEGDGSAPETTTSHQQKEVAYAKCLRSHGVLGVAEPRNGLSIVNGLGGSDPGSPQLHNAQKACDDLLPSGGPPSPQMHQQAVERGLKFSLCMRSHGVPSFPDSGGGSSAVRIGGPSSGLDPNSPQSKAAGRACQRYFGPAGSDGPQ